MALALGNTIHGTTVVNGNTGQVTISTIDATGVLVLCVEINGGNTITVSSPTLGSTAGGGAGTNGGPWVLQGTSNVIPNIEQVYTAPYTSTVTSELISVGVDSSLSFCSMDAYEVRGAPTSSYLDADSPVIGTAGAYDPLTISTATANTFICGTFRCGTPALGTGWNQINAADFHLVEYQIVSSTQTNLSVPLGASGAGSSNGSLAFAIVAASAAVNNWPGSAGFTGAGANALNQTGVTEPTSALFFARRNQVFIPQNDLIVPARFRLPRAA